MTIGAVELVRSGTTKDGKMIYTSEKGAWILFVPVNQDTVGLPDVIEIQVAT